MRLSTKGRYAVNAMLHLAMHNEAGPVPLAEVSDCQSISLSYVDQIFSRLRRAGLIQGIPGPGGGYRLARPMEEITVGEVFRVADGGRAIRRGSENRLGEAIWGALEGDIDGFLAELTLADFVKRPAVRKALLNQYRRAANWRCDACGTISSRSKALCAGWGAAEV